MSAFCGEHIEQGPPNDADQRALNELASRNRPTSE
jgi:hypothetical protein